MKIKFCLSFILTICSMCLCSSLFAETVFFGGKCGYEKVYIDSKSLVINDQGILIIDHLGCLRPATAVSMDSQGLFVFLPQFWYCDRCQREHWGACPMDN